MSHKRTQIRDAVVAMLSGNTAAADRVYPSRVEGLWAEQYPLILVYSREETSQGLSSKPKPANRQLRIAIEIRASLTGDVDKALDDIAAEVESIIDSDFRLRGTAQSSNLVSTELDASAEGLKPIGAARLTYEVVYVD